jgi:hypothetical protein
MLSPPMPTRSQPPRAATRYAYADLTKELERFMQRSPRGTRKRLAGAAGLTADAFSHRMSGRYRFSFEELGAIALEAGAPTGWPFIRWEVAEACDAFRKLAQHSGLP